MCSKGDCKVQVDAPIFLKIIQNGQKMKKYGV